MSDWVTDTRGSSVVDLGEGRGENQYSTYYSFFGFSDLNYMQLTLKTL